MKWQEKWGSWLSKGIQMVKPHTYINTHSAPNRPEIRHTRTFFSSVSENNLDAISRWTAPRFVRNSQTEDRENTSPFNQFCQSIILWFNVFIFIFVLSTVVTRNKSILQPSQCIYLFFSFCFTQKYAGKRGKMIIRQCLF